MRSFLTITAVSDTEWHKELLIDESRKKLRYENLFFPDARIFLPQKKSSSI
jgi:hypothetical protein